MKGLQGRPRVLTALALVLAVAGAYLCFELGRYQAGYSLLDHDRDVKRLRKTVAGQQADLEDAQRQLAVLTTSRRVDRETYARVEASLSELESRVQAQEEELEFYRGIVSPATAEAGLRVQSLQVRPGSSERRYVLQMVLMQSIVHNQRVEGVVTLKVLGTREGKQTELALRDVAVDDDTTELAYAFRYFEALEQDLELPKGFSPQTLQVEISPSSPRGDPTTQEFQWSMVLAE